MAALVEGSIDEVLSKVVSDIQLATGHCIQLKEEQDKAVRDLLKGKDVFAVLPTGYSNPVPIGTRFLIGWYSVINDCRFISVSSHAM